MPDKQRLEEQIISQEAERRLSNQLDDVEQINVDVETDLLKTLQGKVDAVSLTGQGLVIQENIRVQEIKLQTDSIAINPLSALLGQIELNQPVNAVARIVLTEADINRALNSDFVCSKMQNYNLNVDGEIYSFKPQQIQIFLPSDGKIEFRGKVLLEHTGNTQSLAYTAKVHPRTHSQPLTLESFNCTEGNGISLEVVVALMQTFKELVNLPYFEWDNTVIRIKDIEIKQEKLTILIETNMKQIPTSLNSI